MDEKIKNVIENHIENNDDENTGRGNTFEACRGEMHF